MNPKQLVREVWWPISNEASVELHEYHFEMIFMCGCQMDEVHASGFRNDVNALIHAMKNESCALTPS